MLNNQTGIKLINRASKDGYAAYSFHSKCDNISNTVTIIKTTSNSVFEGFTSATWKSSGGRTYDSNAFIFSLRRSGNLNKERLNVTQPTYMVLYLEVVTIFMLVTVQT
jgi:DNA-binding beta-propeller fold protein YncE